MGRVLMKILLVEAGDCLYFFRPQSVQLMNECLETIGSTEGLKNICGTLQTRLKPTAQ